MSEKDIAFIWSQVFDIVKGKSASTVGLNVHMKDATPVSIDSTSFTIAVPMSINRNMIQFRYKECIESALEEVTAQKLSLKIILHGEEDNEKASELNESKPPLVVP